jgi:hypothetical protein
VVDGRSSGSGTSTAGSAQRDMRELLDVSVEVHRDARKPA